MSSVNLSRTLVLPLSAFSLCLTLPDRGTAQQQGDAQIEPASKSVIDSLDSLEQLLLAPLDEAKMSNLYVTPQYRRERYEGYSEIGQVFDDEILNPEAPLRVDSPDFEAESLGIAIGYEYLLNSKWLLGAEVNYAHTTFDYETPSEADVLGEVTAAGDINDFLIGDPVDREIDEYGISLSAGYLAEPWIGLLTLSYSRRNIETETRKVGSIFPDDGSPASLNVLEGNFNSNVYSADFGASYRIRSGSLSWQPFASIGYQIEDVGGYTEEFTSLRLRNPPDSPDFFTRDPFDPTIQPLPDVSSDVDGQTIRSIPGKVGVLLSAPLTSSVDADSTWDDNWKLRLGLSFTHDFSDQKRRIRSFSNLDTDNDPDTIVNIAYEEQNRNRDFFSLTAALGYNFSGISGSLNYQRDIGFDERLGADTVSLQLRVPF